MARPSHFADRDAAAAKAEHLARLGHSMRQAAEALGVSKSTVCGLARDYGIAFAGPRVIGPGCNTDQARRGWRTRRAHGWTPAPMLARVNHSRGRSDRG